MKRIPLLLICVALTLGMMLAFSASAETPKLMLSWSYDEAVSANRTATTVYAVVPYDSYVEGLHHDGWAGDVWIEDYDALAKALGGKPEWTVDSVSTPDLDYEVEYYDEHICLRTDWERPQSASTEKLKVTCKWGGQTAVLNLNLKFEDVPLPTGCNVPDVFDLKVGQKSTFELNFDDDYHYKGEQWYSCSVIVDGERDYDLFDSLFDIEISGDYNEVYAITPKKIASRCWPVNFSLVDRNVAIEKTVLFRVADAKGNMPEYEPEWNTDDHVKRAVRAFADDTFVDNFLFGARIDNLDLFERYLGQEAHWKAWVEDADWNLETDESDDGNELGIWIADLPDEPQTAKVVTQIWFDDGTTFEHETVVEFVKWNMPKGATLPESLHLVAGEPQAVTCGFTPANYAGPDGEYDYWINIDTDVRWDWEQWDGDNRFTRHITFYEPGIYGANIGIRADNVMAARNILIYVSDPDPDVELEKELDLRGSQWAEFRPINMENWDGDFGTVNPHFEDILGEFWIEESFYYALLNEIGGEPNWYVEQNGVDLGAWAHIWDDGNDPRGMMLEIEKVPTKATSVTYTVYCDWGDYHAERTFTMQYKKLSSVPKSLNIADEIHLVAGERTEIPFSITPVNWSVSEERWFDVWATDADMEARCEYEDNGGLYITANRPGTYTGVICLCEGNILKLVKRNIHFYVENEIGVVPQAEINWDYPAHVNRVIGPGDDEIFANGYLFEVYVHNYEALCNIHGSSGEWSYSISGSKWKLGTGNSYERFEFWLEQDNPSKPQTATIHFELKFGDGAVYSGDTTVSFINQALPTAAYLPGDLIMVANWPREIRASFEPEDYYVDGEGGGTWIDVFGVEYDRRRWDEEDPHNCTIRIYEPGTYDARVYYFMANVEANQDIKIKVLDADQLTWLELPEDLTSIGDEAFMGIKANVVIVPNGCKSIGSRAFANCPNLVEIRVPEGCEVAEDVFDYANTYIRWR